MKMAAWFWDEHKRRVQERRARGIAAQLELSKINAKMKHRPVEGLGQCVFRIHPLLRRSIADEFGWEAATNDEFCSELIRDNDWMCFVPSYEQKPMIIKTRDLARPTVAAAAPVQEAA